MGPGGGCCLSQGVRVIDIQGDRESPDDNSSQQGFLKGKLMP